MTDARLYDDARCLECREVATKPEQHHETCSKYVPVDMPECAVCGFFAGQHKPGAHAFVPKKGNANDELSRGWYTGPLSEPRAAPSSMTDDKLREQLKELWLCGVDGTEWNSDYVNQVVNEIIEVYKGART